MQISEYKVVFCVNLPDSLKNLRRDTIYIQGEQMWYHCPCECQKLINLPIIDRFIDKERWTLLRMGRNTISIHPSIHHHDCGAHYFIQHNKVLDCNNPKHVIGEATPRSTS